MKFRDSANQALVLKTGAGQGGFAGRLPTYLTPEELSDRIKYDQRTIRERLKDSVLLEGVHYIRPFGGRKILYVWERIEEDMAVRARSFH